MAKLETAPSYTSPASDEDVVGELSTSPAAGTIDMEHYRNTRPLWERVWRHSFTQMMLLSMQAFCGPAMSDAIQGLGGGGLATPQTSNIA